MKQEVEVTSQQQLEAVCGAGDIAIVRSGSFTACGSSQVTAYGSSQVTACGSSQVTAYGSSQVTAYGSSQVTACGSSQVRACDSSQVTASKRVAVTIHGRRPKVKGGIQIRYKSPATVKEWLADYGVIPVRGVVTLYKIVRDDFKSQHGTSYAPGTTPKAEDWDGGAAECGGGLHFCPLAWLCVPFDSEGTRYVACPVKVSEIVVHKDAQYPTKIKAPRVYKPTWEVDINGNSVEQRKEGGR